MLVKNYKRMKLARESYDSELRRLMLAHEIQDSFLIKINGEAVEAANRARRIQLILMLLLSLSFNVKTRIYHESHQVTK